MSYWITKFKDVTLPTRAGRHEVGVGPAFGSVRTLSGGGGFDPRGALLARREPWRITVEGTVVAATDAALVAACGSVRALLGEAGTLYRTPDGGTADSQWTWARCVDVAVTREPPSRLHCPMRVTFEVQSASWYGTALQTAAYAVAAGVTTVAGVVNAGNAAVWDAEVWVKATGAMTAFSLRGTAAGYETHITFGGTIPSGGTLILHCGSLTVTNNGTPAFGGFAYGANARRPEWLILQPATTNLSILPTGAAGTVTFRRYDAYA